MRTGKLLVGFAALVSVFPQMPPAEIATEGVGFVNKMFSVHQGFSAVHAMDSVVDSTFSGSAQGATLKGAASFDGGPIPVALWFSESGSFPTLPDGVGGTDRAAVVHDPTGREPLRIVIGSDALTVEQEKAAKPSSEFKECANGCPVMVVIPAGSFIMGSPENELVGTPEYEADHHDHEFPQHEVTLAKPF